MLVRNFLGMSVVNWLNMVLLDFVLVAEFESCESAELLTDLFCVKFVV